MFYVIHGALQSDPPVIALGIASMAQSLVIVYQYFQHRHREIKSDRLPTSEDEADDVDIVEEGEGNGVVMNVLATGESP